MSIFVPKMPLDHITFPEIAPIPEGVQRPFWSVMIPTYNRPDFLSAAIKSVLDEGYGPDQMQIMVVDNATSVADIGELVREIGQGRVEYFRQPQHVSLQQNWTTCIQQARGHWVMLLHDDSVVVPGYFAAYEAHIERHQVPVIISQGIAIGEDGRWLGITNGIGMKDEIADYPYQIIAQWNTYYCIGQVVRRDLYEQVGGYSDDFFYGCDHEMTTRLFRASDKVGFMARPYVMGIQHSDQSSSRFWREKQFDKHQLVAWQLIIRDNHLPPSYIYRAVSESLAAVTESLIVNKYYSAAWHNGLWAFRLSPSLRVGTLLGSILYVWWLKKPVQMVNKALLFIRRVLGFIKRRVRRVVKV